MAAPVGHLDGVKAVARGTPRPSRRPARCSQRGRCSHTASPSPPPRARRHGARSVQVCASAASARCAQASVTPPITRGVASCSCPSTPGSMRSGANATNTSSPTSRPRRCSGLHEQLARGADVGGGGQHDRLARAVRGDDGGAGALQDRAGRAAAARRRAWARRSARGRPRRARRSASVSTKPSPARCSRSAARSGTSSSTLPSRIASRRREEMSIPTIRLPALRRAMAVGNPTYPNPTTATTVCAAVGSA